MFYITDILNNLLGKLLSEKTQGKMIYSGTAGWMRQSLVSPTSPVIFIFWPCFDGRGAAGIGAPCHSVLGSTSHEYHILCLPDSCWEILNQKEKKKSNKRMVLFIISAPNGK